MKPSVTKKEDILYNPPRMGENHLTGQHLMLELLSIVDRNTRPPMLYQLIDFERYIASDPNIRVKAFLDSSRGTEALTGDVRFPERDGGHGARKQPSLPTARSERRMMDPFNTIPHALISIQVQFPVQSVHRCG
jgi:hypothetical protein